MLLARAPLALIVILWTGLALAAVVQQVVERVTLGPIGGPILFRQDLWLLAMWAIAVPSLVYSARWWPVRGANATRHAAWHLVAATAFIVATNVIVRVPMLLPPASSGMPALAADTLLGLARFYPAALVIYGCIVALATAAWASVQAPAVTPVSEEQSSGPADADAMAPPAEARPDRVIVREWNRVHLVRPDDIVWIEADDNNVVVHTTARTYKGRGRIGDLESQLDASIFVRIHRSAIVRVESIREVQPLTKGDLAVVMHDGKVLRVARSRRAGLETALGVSI
jgi:DNA-binding LytR/AlgR family response regulator